MDVRLEEALPFLLNVGECWDAAVRFLVDKILYPIEIKPQILLAGTIADDLKLIVDGVVDLPEYELHVGPILSIVIYVEQEMVEIAEQRKEGTLELAMARHSNGPVDGDECSLANVVSKANGLWILGRNTNSEKAFPQRHP